MFDTDLLELPAPPEAPSQWIEDYFQAGSTSVDVDYLDADQALGVAAECAAAIARAQAQQLRALARFAKLRPDTSDGIVDEFAADELAPVLRITGNAAQAALDLAVTLTRRLPGTLAALRTGALDLPKTRIIAELTAPLTDSQAAAVERQVLPRAAGMTAPAWRQAARRAVLRIDPHGAQARHQQRLKDRCVAVQLAEDGMADLSAHLAAPDAEAAFQRIDALPRAARAGDRRTLNQRRADTLVDLILGRAEHPTGTCSGCGPAVQVLVPLSTLLGRDDEPGELAGHGPIDAHTARELAAAGGTWRRLVTEPLSGTVLDVGRRVYRPPAGLARHLRVRDRRCPGCHQPVRRCHLDHTVPYPQGPTSACNLATLCGHHHRLKHQAGWSVVQHPGGVLTWTSPTGRTHTTHPEPPLDLPQAVRLPGPSPQPASGPGGADGVDPPPFF